MAGDTYELNVLRPADQCWIVDAADLGDAHAHRLLVGIARMREEVRARGYGCALCGSPLLDTKRVTYLIAERLGSDRGVTAVVCAECTDTLSHRDLCLRAPESLSDMIIADAAAVKASLRQAARVQAPEMLWSTPSSEMF